MLLAYSSVSSGLPLTACPKVAEYSNEKPFSHSALRKRIHAPSSPPLAPRWPFVHQHQVVALEGVDGDGLVAHLVAELGDLEDLDRLPGEQPAPVLVEQLRVDARRLELAQVLLRQPLVGREQQDAVQLAPPAVLFQVVLVLEDVGVHQQRLAAAGGAPVGQLVELRPGLGGLVEGRDLVGLGLVRVVGGHLRVQRREQRLADRGSSGRGRSR